MIATRQERDERICALYVEGQSSIEIGKLLGMDSSRIRQILRANGVELRRPLSNQNIQPAKFCPHRNARATRELLRRIRKYHPEVATA